MIAAAAIDFDHRIIPDEISLGGLLVALVAVPAAQWADGTRRTGPRSSARRSARCSAPARSGAWASRTRASPARSAAASTTGPARASRSPRPGSLDYWTWFPGVGFGDVKLLAMIGAVIGPLGALEAILAASFAGLVLGIAWAAVTRQWNAPFGFAPALAAGALLVVLSPVHLIPGY